MQVNDLASIDPNVDYNQILPIQQKRTIAFINHFVMNTVSFLNNFAQSCESRLMEFECKLQEVESTLLILESQLSSISHLDEQENVNKSESLVEESVQEFEETPPVIEEQPEQVPQPTEHVQYQRFLKMLHVGVPAPAVKLKMQSEGLDPSILDSLNHAAERN